MGFARSIASGAVAAGFLAAELSGCGGDKGLETVGGMDTPEACAEAFKVVQDHFSDELEGYNLSDDPVEAEQVHGYQVPHPLVVRCVLQNAAGPDYGTAFFGWVLAELDPDDRDRTTVDFIANEMLTIQIIANDQRQQLESTTELLDDLNDAVCEEGIPHAFIDKDTEYSGQSSNQSRTGYVIEELDCFTGSVSETLPANG